MGVTGREGAVLLNWSGSELSGYVSRRGCRLV